MATTTPNYGWAVPTSTDLVKDGATAIETLGDSIDASMFTALGTKKAGMVLLNTTSFSGVSSQSINDVFSTTYESYKILVRLDSASASGALNMRMRVGGSDLTTGTYNYAYMFQRSSFISGRAAAQTSLFIVESGNTSSQYTVADVTIHGPFLTERTKLTVNAFEFNDNALDVVGGEVADTVSYTGFTVFPGSGTITGSVSVYGYNK
jgi:hypothetical protein